MAMMQPLSSFLFARPGFRESGWGGEVSFLTTLSGVQKLEDSQRSSQQRSNDAQPLRIERLAAHGLTCPPLPIGGITLIAFLAVQVGMHPRTVTPFVLLGGFVRLLPIAFAIPPQSGEGVRESGWRLGRGERFAEIV
jgi:hypothetical protein